MTNTLTKSIYLRAAPAKVWEYLTQPEKLATWFHKPTMALAEGEGRRLRKIWRRQRQQDGLGACHQNDSLHRFGLHF
jgi:uncharacterized protein YndB with AHSA1/START domain